MKTLILASAIVLLASCQTTREYEINGEQFHEVTCNGAIRTFTDCEIKASELCKEQDKYFTPVNRDGHQSIGTVNGRIQSGINRSMTFKCVDKPMPQMIGD